jgi:error-prone DNA polymerase
MGRGRDPGIEQLGPEQSGSWRRGHSNVLRFDPCHFREKREEAPPHPSDFADLVTATNYSFLRGASHPCEMVAKAIDLGHSAIGIADRNTVAGVVRARVALRDIRETLQQNVQDTSLTEQQRSDAGRALRTAAFFRLVTGARLCFADGTPDIVAYPINRHGWGRLTRLLSTGNLKPHVKKGDCDLRLADLLDHAQDMVLIAMAGVADEATLALLAKALPGRLWLGVTVLHEGRDHRAMARIAAMADRLGVPLLATCDALYAGAGDRPLHDVVTCIREGVPLAKAGKRLLANAERNLKAPQEMERLFRAHPEAVTAWRDVLGLIEFDLGHLKYEYPHEPVPAGWEPQAWLEHETLRRA